jgi:adenylate cyclase
LVDYTWTTLAAFLPWVGSIFMRFVMEFKLKMQIKKQFGTYLSPALVEKLQKNPGLLKLGGESKELTILFSDIRGYTALSEHFGKDVQGLTSLINRYMDVMLPIVMKNEGTVGKLIGDAVMAWWSAPIHVKDQATLAIKAAQEMNIALVKLNEESKAQGIPTLSIGIGINTGEVVVGNMGSTERFSYDILGDAVNLASRIEGQTKEYGVLIILGENTVKKYKKEQENAKTMQLFELDCIAVKGKKDGARIYTVLENNLSESQYNTVVSGHFAFLNDYRMQRWDSAISHANELMTQNKELKKYYEMMIERMLELCTQNLDKDWDGVYRATSK